MAPLIVMLAAWLVARWLGFTGVLPQAASWTGALRIGLAVMFVFTAASHFHPRTRPDLIRMVPASLPVPALLVTAHGRARSSLAPSDCWCRRRCRQRPMG